MPIITISRGSGSGGRSLAERLAVRLGYELLSREEVVQQAASYGASEQELGEAILKPPGFWDRFRHQRQRYLAFVQAALCERADRDNLVYHGNAGQLLLRGVSHVVCLRLISPLAFRVEMVMKREGLDRKEAERIIERVDRQRQQWTHFLYGVDWLDPTLYDLVINLRTLDLEGAVEVAAAVTGREEFAPTEQSRRAMSDLSLASRVQAAIAADTKTASASVEVRADSASGRVSIRGRVRPTRQAEAVVRVASQVQGVLEVDREDLAAPDYTV
jgi:cytidylate kinase